MGSEHLGKVCEIIGERDGLLWLRLPNGQAAVDASLAISVDEARSGVFSERQVLKVGELPFGVGDKVSLIDGRRAEIVDCVWHYAKAQPMYFLGFDRKLSSRRYFADELRGAE